MKMHSIFATAIVLLCVIGCSEKQVEKVSTTVVPTPPTITKLPREKTYEERRDEATGIIQGKKELTLDKKVRVDLSPLAGRKGGDLYADYLGMNTGFYPKYIEVSFEERMATLYHKKVNYIRCSKKIPDKCTVASDTVLSQAPRLLDKYVEGDKMIMSPKEFITIAEGKVALAKQFIDWPLLCKNTAYRLDVKKCGLLRDIVNNLNGKDLVAYGMTELFPSEEGDYNIKYMDILLRNAGAQFLYTVPALGDGYASLGFYQFTFYALRDDTEKTEGANVVNAFVKTGGEKIPGSVVDLTGHQHHTAAFYFAVHNIAHFLTKINPKQVETLARIHPKKLDEMVVFIACAHHTPRHTLPVMRKWLDSNGLKTEKKMGKNKKAIPVPIEVNLVNMFAKAPAGLGGYARKSESNLRAVYSLKK